MDGKLGYGAMTLIALFLSVLLFGYELANTPMEVPAQISYTPAPMLNAYPELERLRVHINSATVEELKQLPKIGTEKAKAIRAYIANHGSIKKPSQLLEIDGIGEGILDAIKPYLIYN